VSVQALIHQTKTANGHNLLLLVNKRLFHIALVLALIHPTKTANGHSLLLLFNFQPARV
jgi:hypothetical protein